MCTIIARVVLLVACGMIAPPLVAQDDAAPPDHPLDADCTGLDWATPFVSALERAQQTKRLLLIKPVAFGTTPDGGW